MSEQPRLQIVPCPVGDAEAFVALHHRHRGWKSSVPYFAIAVADEAGTIRGVAIVGRPVSTALSDGWTAEVHRVATDECENACSALYGACWRAAKALGWRKLITYTLSTEPGTSLRAAGWRAVHEQTTAYSWSIGRARPRVDRGPLQPKLRWEAPETTQPQRGATDAVSEREA